MSLLEKTIQSIRGLDQNMIEGATQRQSQLTKPPGSLGRLEEIFYSNGWDYRATQPYFRKTPCCCNGGRSWRYRRRCKCLPR